MTDIDEKSTTVTLSYVAGEEDPERGIFGRRPLDPEFTDELGVAVYPDDGTTGVPEFLRSTPLQVQLSGTPRALEALGTYLIALARLETADPNPHEHFEDVRNVHAGGTLHLIVRRGAQAERDEKRQGSTPDLHVEQIR
jgi:hypothetical protein